MLQSQSTPRQARPSRLAGRPAASPAARRVPAVRVGGVCLPVCQETRPLRTGLRVSPSERRLRLCCRRMEPHPVKPLARWSCQGRHGEQHVGCGYAAAESRGAASTDAVGEEVASGASQGAARRLRLHCRRRGRFPGCARRVAVGSRAARGHERGRHKVARMRAAAASATALMKRRWALCRRSNTRIGSPCHEEESSVVHRPPSTVRRCVCPLLVFLLFCPRSCRSQMNRSPLFRRVRRRILAPRLAQRRAC